MNIKTYKFSYGSTLKKFISKTISLIYNIFIGTIILLIFAFIVSEVNYLLRDLIDENIMNICKKIDVYLGAFIFGFITIPSFFPQKVKVGNGMIKIYRHCLFLSFFMIFRGFNDTILFSQIEEICRPVNKDKFFEPIPVNVIDWDNMVIIKTKSKYYYVPVENSDDFIAQITQRIDVLN